MTFWVLGVPLVIPAFLIANRLFPSASLAETLIRTGVLSFALAVLCGLVLGATGLVARTPYMIVEGLVLLGVVLAVPRRAESGQRPSLPLADLGIGPAYDDQGVQAALVASGLVFTRVDDLPGAVADLLAEGRVVLCFQGRMEYGPRALGHRSILARSDRPERRDRLNLIMKRRVWYQPFCPSMLETDARSVLTDYKGAPNRHMTTAYTVRPESRPALAGC